MKMIVNTKSKKEEKAVKNFLDNLDIEFAIVEEEAAVYKTSSPKQITKKEKQILENLSQSVDFVNKHRKGKVKAKPLNQFLNEVSSYLRTLNSSVKLTPDNELSHGLKKLSGAFKVAKNFETAYFNQMEKKQGGTQSIRKGWGNSFKKMAKNEDDKLLLPDVFKDEKFDT